MAVKPDHFPEMISRQMALLDHLPALIGYWDTDLRNVLANRPYVEYFGLTPEQMRGMHIREVLGPELYALNRAHMERALAGEPQLFDREILTPDGTTRYTQASYIPHIEDGAVRGLVVLVTDITARRLAERALAEAEERFRLAFSGSPVGMALVDASGALTQVNPSLCAMLGREERELTGRWLSSLLLEEQEDSEFERVLAGEEEAVSSERRFVRGDGSTMWAIVSIALASDAHGEQLRIVQIQDISRLKTTEEELRRSRTQLIEAERLAQTGSWELDLASGVTTWSDGLYSIYMLTPETFDPTIHGALDRVYQEDRELVSEAMARAVEARRGFTVEYRALRADGRVRTLRNRAEVVVDDEGRPIRILGIAQDVTEARIAEEALASASADLERRARELKRGADTAEPRGDLPLTPRQMEIVELVARGMTNGAIAERLVLTEATVKWHVKQILAKTGAANRAEAVALVLGVPGDRGPGSTPVR